jgi:hypothetical protein
MCSFSSIELSTNITRGKYLVRYRWVVHININSKTVILTKVCIQRWGTLCDYPVSVLTVPHAVNFGRVLILWPAKWSLGLHLSWITGFNPNSTSIWSEANSQKPTGQCMYCHIWESGWWSDNIPCGKEFPGLAWHEKNIVVWRFQGWGGGG